MKHIRNYMKVFRMINAHYRAEIEKTKAKIAELEKKDLPTGDEWNDDRRELERLKGMVAGPKKLRNGKLRWYPKCSYHTWWHKDLERLDAADRAGEVSEITFKIEWNRSRTWGSCPSCETWVKYEGGSGEPIMMTDPETGRREPMADVRGEPYLCHTHYNPRTYASGCGYDKRSTVMCDGMRCPAVDRLIIEHEKSWKCYAVESRDGLPHLEFGGKGTETLRQLFVGYCKKPPIPGFEWTWEEGKTWDYVHIVRKAKGKK